MLIPDKPLEPGDRLGPYKIVRNLGRGAYGAVYEVTRGTLGSRAVLKVLLSRWRDDAHIVERFTREARALAELHHKNIVEVRELGEIDEKHFIEMEYLEGEPLKARLARTPILAVTDALEILLPIVAAVDVIHRHKYRMVHRDLKPDNIYLVTESDGTVVPKVLDFGVAHVEIGDEEMTDTPQQIGTPSYMSPEQVLKQRDVDGRADQWALAVILFEMLTGRRPFFAPRDRDRMEELITEGPTPTLQSRGVEAPDGLDAVIHRALSKSRHDRYDTVRDFGVALLEFARVETRARFESLWGVPDDVRSTLTLEKPASVRSMTPLRPEAEPAPAAEEAPPPHAEPVTTPRPAAAPTSPVGPLVSQAQPEQEIVSVVGVVRDQRANVPATRHPWRNAAVMAALLACVAVVTIWGAKRAQREMSARPVPQRVIEPVPTPAPVEVPPPVQQALGPTPALPTPRAPSASSAPTPSHGAAPRESAQNTRVARVAASTSVTRSAPSSPSGARTLSPRESRPVVQQPEQPVVAPRGIQFREHIQVVP